MGNCFVSARRLWPFSVLLAVLLSLCKSAFAGPLIFTDGGSIMAGSTQVSLQSGGLIVISNAQGDVYNVSLAFTPRNTKTFLNGSYLADKKLVVDAGTKTTAFTGTIRSPALPTPLPVRYSLTLTPDNRARVTLQFETETPVEQQLSLASIFFGIDRATVAGSEALVDGRAVPIVAGAPTGDRVHPLSVDSADPRDVLFFPRDPARCIGLHAVQTSGIDARDDNVVGHSPSIELRLRPKDNRIVFDIVLPTAPRPASAETYGGVDYYAADRVHLPQYGLSRNLIQNPGFEEGFRYWNFATLGSVRELKNGDSYRIRNGGAHTGRRCLTILGEAGQTPSLLATFAIPVDTGRDYTLSFYARSDTPDAAVNVMVVTSRWADFPVMKSVPVNGRWQRYSMPFKAPNAALSVQFGISNPAKDIVAFIDDVQLERGAETDFTTRQASLSLVTNHRDNLFQPGEAVGARWEIHGPANATGTLEILDRDFSGTVRHHLQAIRVRLDAGGTAVISEPWAEKAGRGLSVQEANLKLKGQPAAVREYARIVILPAVRADIRHHTLFAAGGTGDRRASWDRVLGTMAALGIGSGVNFDPPAPAYLAAMARHHIVDVSSIFQGGDSSGKWNLKRGWTGTDADLPEIEENAYQKAKASPEIRYWKLVNEPGSNLIADPEAMKQLLKPLAAARHGILRANARAKIFSPDPANMMPKGGTQWIDTFLSAGGKSVCDLIAIHPYRMRPEEPDMDADMAVFLAMLDRHGYHGDVWLTEGGGHSPMNNPAFGIDVHKSLSTESAGNWRIGPVSYDLSWGERLAAAYAVRAWLVGLKYGDRIKQQVEWYLGSGTFGYDGTPYAEAGGVNTLANTLGDATFTRDIALGDNARAYLFTDGQKRPVAVIWTHDLIHENAPIPGPILHLEKAARDLAISGMVGETITPGPNGDIRLSPFPIFLRGKPGTGEALAERIEAAGKVFHPEKPGR